MNTLLLLGAGASIPAGMPSSHSLTRDAISHLEGEYKIIAEYVYSLIQTNRAEQSSFGSALDEPIYIETLVNALSPWEDKSVDKDLFALVKEWQSVPSGLADYYKHEKQMDYFKEHGTFEGMPESTREVRYRDDLQFYGRITTSRLKAEVRKILSTREVLDLSFLNKAVELCATGDLLVATLNYDCTFEEAATRLNMLESINCSPYSDEDISGRLIKAHGSINWLMSYEDESIWNVNDVSPDEMDMREFQEETFLLGGMHKLTYRQPFFDMYVELREKVKEVSNIIVTGYSFSDEHINYILNSWLRLKPGGERQLIVIDPNFLRSEPAELEYYFYGVDSYSDENVVEDETFEWVRTTESVIHIQSTVEEALELAINKYL